MSVTNGTIRYARTIRPADFEGKTAEVALAFNVDEGSTDEQVAARIEGIGEIAKARSEIMLGLRGKDIGGTVSEPETKPAAKATKKAAEKPADKGLTVAADDIAGLGEEAPPPAGDTAGLDSLDDLTSAAPTPITDKDLNAAVQSKNAKLGDPLKIRELIGAYNPVPGAAFTLAEIPQAQRPDFILKLEALA